MKYVDEYRAKDAALKIAEQIRHTLTRPWTLMELCGGQTHSILRFGVDQLLPKELELIHGPGCPVCVTPVERLDRGLELARRKEVIFCTFGDMLRVPGSHGDLLQAKAAGADVRVVYSPMDALALAEANPGREVIFFAVGFETTAPANAMGVLQASRRKVPNFSILVSHVLVPPAMESILRAPGNRVQGFLAAGHVCTVMGFREYQPLAARYRVPIVVTGFEPLDLLEGIWLCVRQLEEGRAEVENQYARSVKEEGNAHAMTAVARVFEVAPREWRGLGEIPQSGLRVREEFQAWDADWKFRESRSGSVSREDPRCQSGRVLTGQLKPPACPEFGKGCTPERPLGATMVSSEGACAAYYRYRGAEVLAHV